MTGYDDLMLIGGNDGGFQQSTVTDDGRVAAVAVDAIRTIGSDAFVGIDQFGGIGSEDELIASGVLLVASWRSERRSGHEKKAD